MNELAQRLADLWELSPRGLINAVDLLLVTYLTFRLLKLVLRTRTWRVVLGLLVFAGALFASDFFELRTLHWILEKATVLAPVALVILFLPELRQAIEGFGRLGMWPGMAVTDTVTGANIIEEIVAAVTEMAEERTGAIIVFERSVPLDDIAENGVAINAVVSTPLIGAVFHPGNPLHDGAMVIRRDQVLAAACRLPLSESPALDPRLHMRHRAAVGITEETDAVAIVVSEERGIVSVTVDGKIAPTGTIQELRDRLHGELRGTVRVVARARKKRSVRPTDSEGGATS